jgi:hypothetical protein
LQDKDKRGRADVKGHIPSVVAVDLGMRVQQPEEVGILVVGVVAVGEGKRELREVDFVAVGEGKGELREVDFALVVLLRRRRVVALTDRRVASLTSPGTSRTPTAVTRSIIVVLQMS